MTTTQMILLWVALVGATIGIISLITWWRRKPKGRAKTKKEKEKPEQHGATPAPHGDHGGSKNSKSVDFALRSGGIGCLVYVAAFVLLVVWSIFFKPHDPAPVITTQAPAAERPWRIVEFQIPAEGLRLYLSPGWKDFPLGGAITIVTPKGETLHDEPGVPNNFGYQPEGWYVFHADPKGSTRGVRIYNRW